MAERWATTAASARVMWITPWSMRPAFISSSTALSALRTSPPLAAASFSRTPASQSTDAPSSPAIRASPRSTAGRTSSAVRALNSNTVERERMALKMVK